MVEINMESKKKQEWNSQVTQLDDLPNWVTKFELHTMEKEKYLSLQECKWKKKHRGMQDDEVLLIIQKKWITRQ